EHERPANGLKDLAGDGCETRPVADCRQQNDEFVAAKPGDGIAVTQHLRQAMADLPEQFVAGLVSERVVDGLEAVQVEEHDRQVAVVALRLDHGAGQETIEETAIRQAGQRVVEGEVLDLSGMGDLLLYGELTAVLKLPAQAAENADDDEPEDAAGGGLYEVDTALGARRRQLFPFGQSRHDRQRETEQFANDRRS